MTWSGEAARRALIRARLFSRPPRPSSCGRGAPSCEEHKPIQPWPSDPPALGSAAEDRLAPTTAEAIKKRILVPSSVLSSFLVSRTCTQIRRFHSDDSSQSSPRLCVCVCVCCSNIDVFGTRTVEPVRKARTSYRRQILFFSPTEAPLLSMATRCSPLLSFSSHFPSSFMLIKRVRGDVCYVRSLSKWPGKLCKRVEPVSSNGKRGGVKPRDCARLNSSHLGWLRRVHEWT